MEEEDVQEIHAHLNGGILQKDFDKIEMLQEFAEVKNILFEPKEPGYYPLKVPIDELQDVIKEHSEIKKFKNDAVDRFRNWANGRTSFLQSVNRDTRTRRFIKEVSESLLEEYKNEKLIDEYAMFQILMNYWDEEMKDDVYLIIEKGWSAKHFTES